MATCATGAGMSAGAHRPGNYLAELFSLERIGNQAQGPPVPTSRKTTISTIKEHSTMNDKSNHLFWGCTPQALAKFKGDVHPSVKAITALASNAKTILNRRKQIVREMQIANIFKFTAKKGKSK